MANTPEKDPAPKETERRKDDAPKETERRTTTAQHSARDAAPHDPRPTGHSSTSGPARGTGHPTDAESDPQAEPQWELNPKTGEYEPVQMMPRQGDEDATRAPREGERQSEREPEPDSTEPPWRTGGQPPVGLMPPFLTPEEDAAMKRHAAMQQEQAGWLPAPPLGSVPVDVRERARFPQPEDDALYEVVVDTLGNGDFALSKGDRFTAAQMAKIHRHIATGARVGAGTKGAQAAYDLPWLLHHNSVRKVGTLRSAG